MNTVPTEVVESWMVELSSLLLGIINFHERERQPMPHAEDLIDTFLHKHRSVYFGVCPRIGQMGAVLTAMRESDLFISASPDFDFIARFGEQQGGLLNSHGLKSKQLLTLNDLDLRPLSPDVKRVYITVDTANVCCANETIRLRIFDWANNSRHDADKCTFVFVNW